MRRNLPPLNALLAFEAAARHESFTKAALELGVAQPAVTRHVANLEGWLNAKLFERLGNVVRLTRLGQETAELAMSTFDRLELGMTQLVSQRTNELVIGASFGMAHLYIMPKLAAMRAATSTTVNFVTSDDYRSFETAAVDVSIRFGTGHFPGYCSDFLMQEECHLVASPDFIKSRSDFDPKNLLQSVRPEWIIDHGDPQNLGWMTWSNWFEFMGGKPPVPPARREVRNYPAMLDMVRHGEGMAIGSVGLEDEFVEAGELVRLGPPVARPGYGYYLVYRSDTDKLREIQGLRDLLLSI